MSSFNQATTAAEKERSPRPLLPAEGAASSVSAATGRGSASGAGAPKLSLLGLPSLPTYYFAIIALTLGTALLASALPGSPLRRAPSLLLIFTVLSVRDFLLEPARHMRARRLRQAAPTEWPRLQRRLAGLAVSQGLPRPVGLRVAEGEHVLYTLGTFRHGYLVVSPDMAADLERDLTGLRRPVAEAALLHELQHIRQKDVVYVGLARSLLRVGVAFCFWGLLLLMGVALLAFAFPVTPLFDPAFGRQLEQAQPGLSDLWRLLLPASLPAQAATTPNLGLTWLFLINAFLPLITTVGLLAWLIWPRLLAVREYYADAGTATAQGTGQAIQQALGYYGNFARERSQGLGGEWLPRLGLGLASATGRWWQWLSPVHPTGDEREQALHQPERVLAAPLRHGLLAGVLSAILDVLLVGTLSAQYAAQVPGVLPVMLGFLAASLSLLPAAIQGHPVRQSLGTAGQIIVCVLVCRMGWHLANLGLLWGGLLFFPGLTAQVLSEYMHTLVGALQVMPGAGLAPADLFQLALDSTVFWLYLGGLITVTLAGLIWLEAWLRAATLTWYGLPSGERRLRPALLAVTIWTLALGVGFWLPLAGGVIPTSSGSPYSLGAWVVIGLVGFSLLLSGGLWLFLHWRFGGRCPSCKAKISGPYHLGRDCPSCGQRLWPGLEANY